MSPDDIIEYAAVAVGFPVREGQTVTVNEQCHGRCMETLDDHTSEKGALGIIEKITMEPNPQQLTILVSVLIDPEKGYYIQDTFDETGIYPQFPFSKYQTQEDIELERAAKAEAAEKDAAKKKETQTQQADEDPFTGTAASQQTQQRGDYNAIMGMPDINASEEDWIRYRLQQANLKYANDQGFNAGAVEAARRVNQAGHKIPSSRASDEEWDAYLALHRF